MKQIPSDVNQRMKLREGNICPQLDIQYGQVGMHAHSGDRSMTLLQSLSSYTEGLSLTNIENYTRKLDLGNSNRLPGRCSCVAKYPVARYKYIYLGEKASIIIIAYNM